MEEEMFDEFAIATILKKYVRGLQLTIVEKKQVEDWISESDSNKAIFQQLMDENRLASDLMELEEVDSYTEQQLSKFNKLIDRQKPKGTWINWVSAAAILFIISISVLLYRYYVSDPVISNDEVFTAISTDILPGIDQATLTFDDGKVITLLGGKKAIKTDKNGTSYLDGTSISSNKVQFATLSTPRKGQYKTILPDGTKVWLNAESSLKYPTQFTSSERYVELQGEGYFEVAHDQAKPFIVASIGQRVKVLGTKFNINSYSNEPSTMTTLVSGSVELNTMSNSTPVKLKPGQQGRLENSAFEVKKVDTESFIAWTQNEFQFNGTSLREVLRQLERWYDIEVDYNHIPNDIKIQATISRDKKLSTVLYSLEKISNLKFQLNKGRRLQITD